MANKKKIKTEYSLWVRCMNGDQSALNEMLAYNKGDVTLLEEVYCELRPWMTSHPNMAMYLDTDEDICPHCLSEEFITLGTYATPVSYYDAVRCECGALSRRTKSGLRSTAR